MKDWPITYRIAVLAALLFCFSVILRQFFVANVGLPIEVAAMDELGDEAKPAQPQKELYPPVPAVLPDLNENYLFNSERDFSDNEREVDSATGSIDLAEVTYAGSLIVGAIRMALVTYKDKAAVAGRSASSRRPGAASRRTPAKNNTEEHRQLAVGNKFMGYIVDKIEKDRIVFKKGDEMVVKFLYDSGKDRSGVGQPINSSPSQPAATTTGNRTVSPPPAITRPPRVMRPKDTAPTANVDSSEAQTIRSRSELLRGLDPNLMLPPPSGGAGDHQRR